MVPATELGAPGLRRASYAQSKCAPKPGAPKSALFSQGCHLCIRLPENLDCLLTSRACSSLCPAQGRYPWAVASTSTSSRPSTTSPRSSAHVAATPTSASRPEHRVLCKAVLCDRPLCAEPGANGCTNPRASASARARSCALRVVSCRVMSCHRVMSSCLEKREPASTANPSPTDFRQLSLGHRP